MIRYTVVAAVDEEGGIGRGGQLPWRLPGDMEHCREVTTAAPAGRRNAVLMGRRTWESLPERFRPLPGRLNLVLSHQEDLLLPAGVLLAVSLDEALQLLAAREDLGRVFVIGGGLVFREALLRPECEAVLLTTIHGRFGCDTFFPELDESFLLVSCSEPRQDHGIRYEFREYRRAF